MRCVVPPIVLITIALGLLHLISKNNAQKAEFDAFLAKKDKAVKAVALAIERALARDARCKAAETCAEGSCLFHACSGTLGEKYCCNQNISRSPCNNQGTCSNKGTLINNDQPNLNTPPGAISSEGDGKPIIIDNIDLRRDVCALKSIRNDLVNAHSENQLNAWLYAATTNGAFISTPGNLACRGPLNNDPLLNCGFAPTTRPWYISATAGPSDIVFLFDRTSLTGDVKFRLRHALAHALRGLDSRDRVAVVSFDSTETTTLGKNSNDQLNSVPDIIDSLQKELHSQFDGGGNPNITKAFEKAFDLLEDADGTDKSSKCAKYIVLMTGKEDACFRTCGPGTECNCVSDLKDYIKPRLNTIPATIVTFSEVYDDPEERNNIEKMSKTIVCDKSASGIWRRVTDSDTNSSALSTFNEIVASSLYEENPKTFSSPLYNDASGLGNVFTLAVPVYVKDDRRLVGVAGADITLKEVADELKSDLDARTLIDQESDKSRSCLTPKERNGCVLQSLRSTRNSAQCADVLPVKEYGCFEFGDDVYVKRSGKVTFDEALQTCKDYGDDSTLAVVDTDSKNKFLVGLFDSDGSWIGLRQAEGDSFMWVTDAKLSGTGQFGFNGSDAARAVIEEQNEAFACVSADRRGISENWNVVACSEKRNFVCQISNKSHSDCERLFTSSAPFDEVNPRDCNKPPELCNDAIEKANPVCNQTGKDYTESDRTCCGGRADCLVGGGGGGLAGGIIAAIIVGVVIVIAIFLVLVICCFRKGMFCFKGKNILTSTPIPGESDNANPQDPDSQWGDYPFDEDEEPAAQPHTTTSPTQVFNETMQGVAV